MGDQPSKGDSSDPVETLCNAVKQMQQAHGHPEGASFLNDGDVRNKLLSAKDAVSQNFGQDPAFHKIIEELEANSTSSIRALEAGKAQASTTHNKVPDGRHRVEFVFRTALEGEQWERKIGESAQASGFAVDDLDDGTLVLQDAKGVEIPTDTDEPPDWNSLRYPVSGYIFTQVHETKDVSWCSDGSLTKTQLRAGDGVDMPRNSSKVKMKVDAATDGTADVPGFRPCTLEFVAGDGEVCDALEIAAISMKRCERAMITCSDITLCSDETRGVPAVSTGKVVFTLELVDFEKAADLKDMSEAEAIKMATSNKLSGSDLFRRGRTRLALARYKTVLDLFTNMDNISSKNQVKVKDLTTLCELNRAACHLALKNYIDAKRSCDFVLRHNQKHVKALYRRAQCDIGCANFVDAIADLKKVIVLDPQNKAARTLLKDAQTLQRQADGQSKNMFAKMLHDPKAQLKLEQPHSVAAHAKERDVELIERQDADCVQGLQDAEAAANEAADSLLKELGTKSPKGSRKNKSKKARGKGPAQSPNLVEAPVSQTPLTASACKVCDDDMNSTTAKANPSCSEASRTPEVSPTSRTNCRPLRWADEELSDEELCPTTCGLQETWDNNKIELSVSLDDGALLALAERKNARLIEIAKASNATCVLDAPASAVLVCGPALGVTVAQNMLQELRSQWTDVSEPVWNTIKGNRSQLHLWQTETGCSIKLDNSAPRIRLTGFSHEVRAISDKLWELHKSSDVGFGETSDASSAATLEPEPNDNHEDASTSSSMTREDIAHGPGKETSHAVTETLTDEFSHHCTNVDALRLDCDQDLQSDQACVEMALDQPPSPSEAMTPELKTAQAQPESPTQVEGKIIVHCPFESSMACQIVRAFPGANIHLGEPAVSAQSKKHPPALQEYEPHVVAGCKSGLSWGDFPAESPIDMKMQRLKALLEIA